MISGKTILVILLVLSSTVGGISFYELAYDKSNTIPLKDSSSQKKILQIELSDGTSSSDKG